VIILLGVLVALIAGGSVFAYRMRSSKKNPTVAPSVVSAGDPRDKVIRILASQRVHHPGEDRKSCCTTTVMWRSRTAW